MPRRVRSALLAASLLLIPVAAVPAALAEEPPPSPGELAAEGLEKMMRAIELFVDAIPMYAPPELLPNGDIIIRRLDPEERETDPRRDDSDGESDEGVTET